MGYNLLYGLYKSTYDADCNLFLGILRGDVKEDVYIQTAQLQVKTACTRHLHSLLRCNAARTVWSASRHDCGAVPCGVSPVSVR